MKKKRSEKNRLIKKHLLHNLAEDYKSALGLKTHGTGIYALYKNGQLYYIGLSKSSLRGRIKNHYLKDRHKGLWDTYSFFQVRRTHYIKDIESLLLHVFMPPGNRVSGRFNKKYNLAQNKLISKETTRRLK
jgi:hypothetical protein